MQPLRGLLIFVKKKKTNNKVPIPVSLVTVIKYVASYVGTETTDWFKIKKELVNLFPPRERSRFSRRHYSTKLHILNLFDKEVINLWETTTGTTLWVDPAKLHPKDWVQKPSGWALRELNEQRKQKAAAAKNSN